MIAFGYQAANGYVSWPNDVEYLIVEPKLDGYRLTAMVDVDGKVTMHCGEPTEPVWAENLGHIREAITELGLRSCLLDGELMGTTWNQTSSLVRRKRSLMTEETKAKIVADLKFHVFDFVPLDRGTQVITLPRRRKASTVVPVPLVERRAMLAEILARHSGNVLQQLTSFEARSETELHQIFDELCEMDFEGAMAKVPTAPYALNDRVDFWLKLKPWKTVEMKVTGSVIGEGKHAGRLGALTCVDEKGQVVAVGGGFTDAQRDELWAKRDQLIGLEIEVRIQVCDVATARHPVFVRFREDRNTVSVQS